MTIASLLLALITAANGPVDNGNANANADTILLDFHAEWCGPCQKMRPVMKQFTQKGYAVRSVDIDRASDLAERYDVHEVPTFIVTDANGRELGRAKGYQPLSELERFYRNAAAKARSAQQNSSAYVGSENEDRGRGSKRDGDREDGDDEPPIRKASRRAEPADQPEDEADARAESLPVNPKPWETGVRIRILGPRSNGYGSGTVIYSTPTESLILTCAHIFKLEGRAKPVPPSQFPREIKIDLFDGKLRGTQPAQVHFKETVEGEAVDYDFLHDVGLIRIRPGRRLPASRVAPAYWQPESRMRMLTVGCSEGQDATAWHTVILNPRMSGSLIGSPNYEAIECLKAPKQGRSGGGLFTDNGYIAGVCNFAEPRGDHGLYATPRSIYRLLDRNQMASLYAPVPRDGGTLLADAPARNRSQAVRLQSPGPDDAEQTDKLASEGPLMMPPPAFLNIADPVDRTADRRRSGASESTTSRKFVWNAIRDQPVRSELQTDLSLDPAADHDHFGRTGKRSGAAGSLVNAEDVAPRPTAEVDNGSDPKPRWRAIRPGTIAQGTESTISQ